MAEMNAKARPKRAKPRAERAVVTRGDGGMRASEVSVLDRVIGFMDVTNKTLARMEDRLSGLEFRRDVGEFPANAHDDCVAAADSRVNAAFDRIDGRKREIAGRLESLGQSVVARSEVVGSFNRVEALMSTAMEMLERLAVRLDPVLGQAMPKSESGSVMECQASAPVARRLDGIGNQIETVFIRTLQDLLDRLEV